LSDSITSLYPVFTPGANDDEFDNESFSGWTAVNSGTQVPTVTETNHVASIVHPGGGSSAYLWAYMKTYSPSANDYIEMAFRTAGANQNYNRVGLIMANGASFSSGSQVVFNMTPSLGNLYVSQYSGYNADNGVASTVASTFITLGSGVVFLRLKYEGSNHFRGYTSPDGISWADITGQVTSTLTPTHIGFCLTPYGASVPYNVSVHYFKQAA